MISRSLNSLCLWIALCDDVMPFQCNQQAQTHRQVKSINTTVWRMCSANLKEETFDTIENWCRRWTAASYISERNGTRWFERFRNANGSQCSVSVQEMDTRIVIHIMLEIVYCCCLCIAFGCCWRWCERWRISVNQKTLWLCFVSITCLFKSQTNKHNVIGEYVLACTCAS